MKTIPVLFRTYNRLQYFYYTLKSFCSTNAKYSCSVQIIDDHSDQSYMKRFLYTNQQFEFEFNMLIDHRFYCYKDVVKRDFSKLQPLKKIIGVGKSFDVIKPQKKGGDKSGLLWTIKYGFQKHKDADFIIILQNDILFHKQWLNKLLNIYEKNKNTAGVISCWNLHKNYLKNSIEKDEYLQLINNQKIGFPVALITRNFFQKLIEKHGDIFEKQYCNLINMSLTQKQNQFIRQKFNLAGDYCVLKYCYQLGFDVFSTKKSYIQHIGVGSTCRYWQKKCWYRSQLFDGDFQYNDFNIGNIYIFSNVKSRQNIEVYPNDILIFINNAVNFYQYKNVKCKKLLFRRYLVSKKVYAGSNIESVENYYVCGDKDNMPVSFNQLVKNYDFNYKTHAPTKQPTTGWVVYNLCKNIFPYHHIKLVNFFPNSDFTTQHDCTHNWVFQDNFYRKEKADIIDTRKEMVFSKQKLYEIQHKENKNYGADSFRFFDRILTIKNIEGINSILDYGCGKATLYKKFKENNINVQFYNYDFAIPQYMSFPKNKRFDLVVCTDVLQHVPCDQLKFVLEQITSISDKCFFSISCRTAINKLPNGQNCHCTVNSQIWWMQFLRKYFKQIQKFDGRYKQLVCFCKK